MKKEIDSKVKSSKLKLLGATAILAGTLLASNILGLVRDRILVAIFPTTVLDTYLAAFRIPDFIYNIFILGALGSAFLPVFASYIAKNKKEEAWRIANTVINFGFILISLISVALFFLAPVIMPYIVPGFDLLKLDATINLTRLMLLAPIFLGISGIFSGILNSYSRFTVAAFSPVFYNIGIIVGAKYLSLTWGIYGVGIGVLAGAFLHMAIQIPSAVKVGFRWQPVLALGHEAVLKIGKLMVPRAIGLLSMQISLVVSTLIASTLKAGSITVFNLANNIQTVPMVIFGLAYATTLFPALARSAAVGNTQKFVNDLTWGIRQILFWIIPSTIGLILLRAQIVRLVFGVGNFTFVDTKLTAALVAVLAVSLFAQATVPLLARAFYAIQDTKTPVLIGITSMVVNIGLAILLTQPWFTQMYGWFFRVPLDGRVVGLGLAFSVGAILNLFLLFAWLKGKIGGLDGLSKMFLPITKIIFSSLVMGGAIYLTIKILAPFVNPDYPAFGLLMQLVGSIAVGFIVYFGTALWVGCEEVKGAKLIFKRFKVREND